jgi:outer membrane protein assembly factor BamA
MNRWLAIVLTLLFVPLFCSAQVGDSQNQHHPGKVVLQDLVLDGVNSLGTSELNDLTSQITGHEYREDANELRERLLDALQGRGFFDAQIKTFEVKALDPLARPKPIRVEAEVAEGPRYRFVQVKLVGNRAFSTVEMRSQVPIHAGDYFGTDKVRSGLEGLRKLYFSHGYLDFALMPSTTKSSDATIVLSIDVTDGPQYRMGDLKFSGNPDLAGELRPNWELAAGRLFDANYPRKFIDENRQLLPAGFNYGSGVHITRDCNQLVATVAIDLDSAHPGEAPKNIGCDKPKLETRSGK